MRLLSGERKGKNRNEVRVWVSAAWGFYSTQILFLAVGLRWTAEIARTALGFFKPRRVGSFPAQAHVAAWACWGGLGLKPFFAVGPLFFI